jgi:hypothetical protein
VAQFVRLMMFVSAIVFYGDVLMPIKRLAGEGEVLPLPTAKLLLHCIWVSNNVSTHPDLNANGCPDLLTTLATNYLLVHNAPAPRVVHDLPVWGSHVWRTEEAVDTGHV